MTGEQGSIGSGSACLPEKPATYAIQTGCQPQQTSGSSSPAALQAHLEDGVPQQHIAAPRANDLLCRHLWPSPRVTSRRFFWIATWCDVACIGRVGGSRRDCLARCCRSAAACGRGAANGGGAGGTRSRLLLQDVIGLR